MGITFAKSLLMWSRSPYWRILIVVLFAQAAVGVGFILYLAVVEKTLVVAVPDREEFERIGLSDRLIIPVAGVRPSELIDTYGAARSGGRRHEGLDIFAKNGTPVLAAAGGVIVGRDSSALGGISLYQRDLDQRTIYFYGHLQRYRAGLKEGDLVRQGEVIGYVGESGNVPAGSPHLHFSVYAVTDPNRWWRGRNLSPCELLQCGLPGEDAGATTTAAAD